MATVGEKLNRLREIIDERERIGVQDSLLSEEKTRLEAELRDEAQRQGVKQWNNDLLTVSFADDMRFKYDPEKWPGIVQWAIETGNLQIIQRRMTDAQLKTLMVEGVALPDGLTPDPYVKISTRRK